MRYFWALMAYVTAIVVAVASCGSKGSPNQFPDGGTGGGHSSGSGLTGGAGGGGMGGGITLTTSSTGGGVDGGDSGPMATCPAAVTCASVGADCGPIS